MKWKRPHKIALLIFLFLLFFMRTSYAGELKHALDVKVELSTGKFIKYNATIPVTVDITNLEGDFNGKLELVYPRGYRSSMDINSYYRDISVPRNGKKRFFLYIPKTSYYTSKIDVRIRKGNDYKEYPVAYNTLQNNDKIILVVNKEKGGFAYLSEFKSLMPQNTSLNIVYPETQLLPEAWKAYDNVDYILINNLPALNLEPEKQKAILDYVAGGGTVVFSSNLDPGEFNNSIFKEYLPLTPEKTVALDKDELIFNNTETVVTTGKVNGEVLYAHEENPILVQGKLGEGSIFFVTADFSRKPFKPDFEEKEIWTRIFRASEAVTANNLRVDNTRVLANLPEMASPPLDKIFWALLVYIVLIGPVNYFYLKKKDKLMNMFITVPLAALIFSTGIFFMGYAVKGSRILLRKFSIVYVSSGQSVGFVDSVVSLFSPAKITYQMNLADKDSTGWELGEYGEMPETVVKEEESMTFEDLTIQMWSMRQFRVQKSKFFKEPFRMDVKEQQGKFTGTIYNGTEMTVTGCVLFVNGAVSAPFELKPGEMKINLPVAQKGLLSPYGLGNHLNDIYGLTADKDEKNPMLDAKKTAISTISESAVRAGGRLLLVGWSEDDLNKVKINRQGAKELNTNLFFVR